MSKKTDKPTVEKAFPGQHDGEPVVLVFRQHPLVMRKALILGLVAILIAVLPLDFPQVYSVEWLSALVIKIMWGVIIFVFLAWFYRWVGWYYTLYIVTARRILAIRQKGFFNRKVDEWQLDGIQNVNYEIGGFQAVIFGFGNITARTYIGDLEMKTIHKPAEIHAQLVDIVRRTGGGSRSVGGSTQPMN
jgi:hypothetical protein